MKKLIFKSIFFAVVLLFITACSGQSKSATDNESSTTSADTLNEETYPELGEFTEEIPNEDVDVEELLKMFSKSDEDSEREPENTNVLEFVPVQLVKENQSQLGKSLDWKLDYFAVKNNGKYVRFDNDGEYSGLCNFPAIMHIFTCYNSNGVNSEIYPIKCVGISAVFDEFVKAYNMTFKPMEERGLKVYVNYPADLLPVYEEEGWLPKIEDSVADYYGRKMKTAIKEQMNGMILYLNGQKDDIDSDMLTEIERCIYNLDHPEKYSFKKSGSRYNRQVYDSGEGAKETIFPAGELNMSFVTMNGDAVPNGSLIILSEANIIPQTR